eukprot:m.65340 g.65340  ORF g.65340 m.65340 type:complete len:168 (+) comp23544_c0_seq1:208-711(+)
MGQFKEQLSIGFGEDIPILPPFVALAGIGLGLVFKLVFGGGSFGVPLPSWSVRLAGFVLAFAWCAWMNQQCTKNLVKAGSGVKFTPVKGITSEGPFAWSRNPMYITVVVAMLAFAFLFDNLKWGGLTAAGFVAYVHFFVIPVEEAFLTEQHGDAYLNFAKTVPRWLF